MFDTVAIAGALELQVAMLLTSSVVASVNVAVALNALTAPLATVVVAGSTAKDLTVSLVTVTSVVAVKPVQVAVTVALPGFNATSTPRATPAPLLTAATVASDDLKSLKSV